MKEKRLFWVDEDSTDTDTMEMVPMARAKTPVERRTEGRFACQLQVVGAVGRRLFSCVSGDVSDRGIFLRTLHAPPVGSFVQLGLATEDEDTPKLAEGHVRWIKADGTGRIVGCGVALVGGASPMHLLG